jgi:glutamate/tyrosine decarboxylase-like PLP-dependent enzyme
MNEEMNRHFTVLAEEISTFQDGIRDLPVIPPVTREVILDHLQATYGAFEAALPLDDVIRDVSQMLRDWNVQVTHPRYFGLFNPSVHPASIYADALVAAYNPQLAAWSHSAAASEMERLTLNLLMTHLGFDPVTSMAFFTSGGAESNLSAITVALTAKFPEYGTEGAPQNAVFYGSQESHGSLSKSAHQTGIGRRALQIIPADANLQMDVNALEAQIQQDLAAGKQPFMVVATAGTTAAGIIDPLDQIAEVCEKYQLWLHVDAAWGGSGVLSPRLRPYYQGIEGADSVTWDAHKWLSVPLGAGMFFCKHRDMVEKTFGITTSYMPPEKYADTFDPYVTSPQWSRRFIGLKLFMSFATQGFDGIVALIEHQTQMGDLLREKLRTQGWTLISETPLPVICFTHETFEGKPERIGEFLQRVYERGSVWLSQVSLAGTTPGLRACITSIYTTEADVDFLVTELNTVLAELQQTVSQPS